METETIGQLIQLFAQLGADAKWAFLAYLGFRAFVVLMIAGTVISIAVLIVRTVRACDGDSTAMREIAEILQRSWCERAKIVQDVRSMKEKR